MAGNLTLQYIWYICSLIITKNAKIKIIIMPESGYIITNETEIRSSIFIVNICTSEQHIIKNRYNNKADTANVSEYKKMEFKFCFQQPL